MEKSPGKDYNREMHTAEHILNQTMIRMFGSDRSVSNHIEKKKSKCDYKFTRPLTDLEILKLEDEVNRVISLNLDVRESLIPINEASEKFNISKLPPDAGESIRIISVGDYDFCPCIGDHVTNTSEIGSISIISTDYNPDSRILRIRYKRR
ncbi:MAG: hypothetical protein Q8R90_06520 [Bacteroidales bacterium]|jgi:Ser-tRNA(Ala) deacylase AlaX|nr:hypothetical protein [Bacteroidales bacterium]